MLPIHHTFAPLADAEQVRTCMKLLWQPRRWKNGPESAQLADELGKAFNGKAYVFGSGREALLAILKSLRFQKDEEIIVQGYTCIVVPNAIIAAGMIPVYADIERDTLNLDLEEVERLITPKTRAIICQHTFGIPAYTQRLRELCNRHSLILIEDCAHIIPDRHGPAEIGTQGDVVFCSFGRDKALSGVSGGAAICRRSDLCPDLARMENDATHMSMFHIKSLLLYPLIYTVSKPLYRFGIGKIVLALCGRLRLLPSIVNTQEKEGRMNAQLHRMPNACAILALQQWKKLESINNHRRMLTNMYLDEGMKNKWPRLLGVQKNLPLQKFPLFIEKAERIRQELKKHNIHLHDGWTGCAICPAHALSENVGYNDGDDPAADMAGEQILSLPTHPTMTQEQAVFLIEKLNTLLP